MKIDLRNRLSGLGKHFFMRTDFITKIPLSYLTSGNSLNLKSANA